MKLPILWSTVKALFGYNTQDQRDKCRRIMRACIVEQMAPIFMGHWIGVHRLNDEQKQKILDAEPF